MSISQALSNATSGLGVAARHAGLVSQNIANALTPGYVRRDLSLAERTIAGAGAGVRVAGTDRAAAPYLTAERRAADGAAARDEVRFSAAKRISGLFGDPQSPGALHSRLSAFDVALRDLANNPSNPAAQRVAASSAKSLASAANGLSQSLQALRQEADRAIGEDVARVNAALSSIEKLNGEIEKATIGDRDASALLDERDRQIEIVNRAIPVRTLVRENGRLDLATPEGVLLLAGSARQLQFAPSQIISAGQSLANGALSGLSVDGVSVTPGVDPRSPAGGSIAGQFFVRDELAVAASNDLDAFAQDLIERFAAAGLDATAPSGAPGLFTDNGGALGVPYAAGLAGRLRTNAAIDADAGGDPSRLRDGLYSAAPGPAGSNLLVVRFVDALNAPAPVAFAGGQALSALEASAALAGVRGGVRSAIESEAAGSQAFRETLAEAELSSTGVDTDAELQLLLIIEQAYAANARVIEVTSRLLERLTEL